MDFNIILLNIKPCCWLIMYNYLANQEIVFLSRRCFVMRYAVCGLVGYNSCSDGYLMCFVIHSTMSFMTFSEKVSSICPYSEGSPVVLFWKRWFRLG